MPRGGKRPGAGRPKGSKGKQKKTIQREMAEEELRTIVRQGIAPIVAAQIDNARGIKYFVVRERKGGKFTRVSRTRAEAMVGMDETSEEIVEVWEKDPSVHAFKELLDRAYGRAKEPERDVNINLRVEAQAILEAIADGRRRLSDGKRSRKR